MKALTAASGTLLTLWALTLAAQQPEPASNQAEKPKTTSGTSQAGTPVRTGAPSTRHHASKSTSSHTTKHKTSHVKKATSQPPASHE
jgi:hypothetical protein